MFIVNEIMLRNLGWTSTNYGFNYLKGDTLYAIDDNNVENIIKFIICKSVTKKEINNWDLPGRSVTIAILNSNIELMKFIKEYDAWPVDYERHFKLGKVLKK